MINMVDIISDALNKIKIYEKNGEKECLIRNSKLLRAIMDTLKKYEYIKDYSIKKVGKFDYINIILNKRINEIKTIKPRFAVKLDEYQKYESRYIPSKDFGILIVSTPQGVMSNREAKEKHLGGRLIAFVY